MQNRLDTSAISAAFIQVFFLSRGEEQATCSDYLRKR